MLLVSCIQNNQQLFLFFFWKLSILTGQRCSIGKNACHQTWWPKFNPRTLIVEEEKWFLQIEFWLLLTSPWITHPVYAYTKQVNKDIIKMKKKNFVFWAAIVSSQWSVLRLFIRLFVLGSTLLHEGIKLFLFYVDLDVTDASMSLVEGAIHSTWHCSASCQASLSLSASLMCVFNSDHPLPSMYPVDCGRFTAQLWSQQAWVLQLGYLMRWFSRFWVM